MGLTEISSIPRFEFLSWVHSVGSSRLPEAITCRDGNGAERGRRMGSSSPPRMDFSYPIPGPPRMMGNISCPIPAP